ARALRTFGYGYLAVALAVYLQQLGLGGFQIGVLLTAAVAGAALMNVAWSLLADGIGRRRTIATMSVLMIAGGLLFALSDRFWLLIVAAFTGTISASSAEVGPFITVEQAILPQTAPDERRTWLFSIYDALGTLAGAAGALFTGAVVLIARAGVTGANAYRPLFLLYAGIGLCNLLLFLSLSPGVEAARVEGARRFAGLHRSGGTVARLSALFGLDALAGGFVLQSIVAYWFHVRWGLRPEALGLLFFWVGVLSGLSLLAAGRLAERFGLLNTMVLTHLPSNVLLLLVPLAPTAWLAVLLFLARMSVSQMDVPTRRSYTMAVVEPDERTAAAGITNLARTAAGAVAPALSGAAIGAGALALPFLAAGSLKIVYDGLIYLTFRDVRPPEERERTR
ncbi:MAG TPA: MFS transporter, partial [Candidatus Dormibacteraeota bacterium]